MASGTRRRLDAGGEDPCAATLGRGILSLAEDERQRALSFVASLPCVAAVAATCRRCRAAGRAPTAWEAASLEVDHRALSTPEGADRLAAFGAQHWGLAREVCLPACRLRRSVEQRLQEAWPQLRLTVAGDGPHLLFAMAAEDFRVGASTQLHFFEPRYRWMCRRLCVPGEQRPRLFGWVTSGRPCPGARGSLCEVRRMDEDPGGTFDVAIRSIATFELLEVWTETTQGIPRAAPLSVGYVRRLEAGEQAPRRYVLDRGVDFAGPGSDSSDDGSDGFDLLQADGIDQVLAELVSEGRGPGGLFPGSGDSEEEDFPEDSDFDSGDS